MQIGEQGIALIERFEGCRLDAYRDPAGIWTIGYGHTGRDVHEGLTIDQAKAGRLLHGDLAWAEMAVDDRTYDVATSQHQFDAMVSLCFNIGAAAFAGSTKHPPSRVLICHRAGSFLQAAAAFLLFDHEHIDGQLVEVEGLRARREAEAMLYRGGPG